MNTHFEQSPGSVPQAETEVIGADLSAAIHSASGTGLRQWSSSVPTCRGGAFSHQDALDYQEWVASGDLK